MGIGNHSKQFYILNIYICFLFLDILDIYTQIFYLYYQSDTSLYEIINLHIFLQISSYTRPQTPKPNFQSEF